MVKTWSRRFDSLHWLCDEAWRARHAVSSWHGTITRDLRPSPETTCYWFEWNCQAPTNLSRSLGHLQLCSKLHLAMGKKGEECREMVGSRFNELHYHTPEPTRRLLLAGGKNRPKPPTLLWAFHLFPWSKENAKQNSVSFYGCQCLCFVMCGVHLLLFSGLFTGQGCSDRRRERNHKRSRETIRACDACNQTSCLLSLDHSTHNRHREYFKPSTPFQTKVFVRKIITTPSAPWLNELRVTLTLWLRNKL